MNGSDEISHKKSRLQIKKIRANVYIMIYRYDVDMQQRTHTHTQIFKCKIYDDEDSFIIYKVVRRQILRDIFCSLCSSERVYSC